MKAYCLATESWCTYHFVDVPGNCRKGKHGLKLHTVFLATVASGAAVGFQPVVNDEHLEVKWVPLSEAVAFPAAQLHPVLAEVLSADHRADLQAAFGVSL